MSERRRTPRVGDIVLYHEDVPEGIWGHSHSVTWPAIVTEVISEHEGGHEPRLRLTVFCPFDKPKWDISAHFADQPRPGCWSWRDPSDQQE
jgi:hypothetical protein